MTTLKKSLQTLGAIAAVSSMIAATPVPAPAQGANPCAPRASRPIPARRKPRRPPTRARRRAIPARQRSNLEHFERFSIGAAAGSDGEDGGHKT